MITRRFALSATALVAAAASTRGLQSLAGPGSGEGDFALRRDDAAWRRLLSPDAYAVLRRGQPERPFSSPLLGERRAGIYACAGCGEDLFASAAKFDAGTGWPSFWASFYGAVAEGEDRSAPVFRAALRCARCGGHLGTASGEAPTPTRLCYGVSGRALAFRPSRASTA